MRPEVYLARYPANKQALLDVLAERVRQEEKWGEQNHNPVDYLAILMEEIGEFAKEAVEGRWGRDPGASENLRTEAVQAAAVALAIVEALDRGKWQWPGMLRTTKTTTFSPYAPGMPLPRPGDCGGEKVEVGDFHDFPRFYGGRE